MALSIVGASLGRTGTYLLKLALNALGFGPTYHMEEVILDMERKLQHWQGVVAGSEDWETIYDGYASAVDWSTTTYFASSIALILRPNSS